MINQEELGPLKERVGKLEAVSQNHGSPSVNIGLIDGDSQNTPSNTTLQWKQDHQKLLEDMKRKRNFYLRKTPLDARLEEIKKQYGCSHAEAVKICYEELDKNRLNLSNLSNHPSPLRGRDMSLEF